MIPPPVQFDLFVETVNNPVNAATKIPLLPQTGECVIVVSAFLRLQRSKEHYASAPEFLRQALHNLAARLGTGGDLAIRAIHFSDLSIDHAQIVVNLSNRADRAAGISSRSFLLDRDSGRKPFNLIHFRFLNVAEKLACVCGKRFNIPPLPLRVDRVECHGCLSGTRHPRKNHQFFPRDRERHVLQVMFPCTHHRDIRDPLHRTVLVPVERNRRARMTVILRYSGRCSTVHLAAQHVPENLPGPRTINLCYLFRRPGRDQPPALVPSLRAQIKNPVCGFHHIHIVLDDNDSVSLVTKPVQHFQQVAGIMKMEAGRRLVENVECPPRAPAA